MGNLTETLAVCQAGKGCRRKLERHLLPLFKLTLTLKHWPPQLRLANSPLWNDRQMTQKPHAPVQSCVLSWFSFSDELVLLCICTIRKLCGHTKGKGRRGHFAREGTQLVRTSTLVTYPKPHIGSFCSLCLFCVCFKSVIVWCFSNKWKKIQSLIILLLSFHNILLIFSIWIEAATEDAGPDFSLYPSLSGVTVLGWFVFVGESLRSMSCTVNAQNHSFSFPSCQNTEWFGFAIKCLC